MVQINPGDLPDLPVEQLAQFLLGCAREDPTLLARSNSGPVVQRNAEVRLPLGEPIDLTAAQDDALARQADESVRQVAPSARPIDAPPQPIDASARPVDARARGIEAPTRAVDATASPVDARAK